MIRSGGHRGLGALALLLVLLAASEPSQAAVLEDATIRCPGGTATLSLDGIGAAGQRQLPMRYREDEDVCELSLRITGAQGRLSMLGSDDFDVVDSLAPSASGTYAAKLRFYEISRSEFLKIRLRDSSGTLLELALAPFARTEIRLDTAGLQWSQGQEAAVEILCNHPGNLVPFPVWKQADGFQYRLVESQERMFLHVLPVTIGPCDYALSLPLRKPDLVDGVVGPAEVRLQGQFLFRKARMPFLRISPQTVLLDDRSGREGIEVQLESSLSLASGRKYLLEESEAPGGPAIGEIFVKNIQSTGHVVGLLRAFNLHRRQSGSLFLKEAEAVRAVTNLDVLPQVHAGTVKVMRNGRDWLSDAVIHPGETVHLRIEGQSLDQARFGFGELDLSPDAAADLSSETVFECKVTVPMSISRSIVPILDHGKPTGLALVVKEYQRAHAFDYLSVEYGNGPRSLPGISGPELAPGTIRDVQIRMDPKELDSGQVLYGKQYVSVEVKVTGPTGNLLDVTTINDLVVCPDEHSPRFGFYDRSDCSGNVLNLNEHLGINTFDLEPWSKISLTFSNVADKHEQVRPPRRIDIYRQQRVRFDVDVSFPFGLLIRKASDEGWGNFSGVSMAMMAKLGFYENGAIDRLEPYELAAGFIALDAFDLSQVSSSRDLGVVALMTLNPVNPQRKLSFPIYFGGGYLLYSHEWFWLLGPGISVQF